MPSPFPLRRADDSDAAEIHLPFSARAQLRRKEEGSARMAVLEGSSQTVSRIDRPVTQEQESLVPLLKMTAFHMFKAVQPS